MGNSLSELGVRSLTIAAAIFYSFIGFNAFRRPRTLLRSFDLIAQTPAARNEIRGIYGGLTVAFALLILSTLLFRTTALGVLIATAALTLGMPIGRLVSAVIDRGFDVASRFWCVAEIVVGGSLACAAWLSSQN